MTGTDFGHFLAERVEATGHAPLRSWRRRLHRRRSSFRLDSVTAHLADGTDLALVCKTTGVAGLATATRARKPVWRHHPGREAWCYEHVLRPLDLGTPRWFGTEPRHRWLLLEDVTGAHPLDETDDRPSWDAAMDWLADLHGSARRPDGDHPLLELDAAGAERSWVAAVEGAPWERVCGVVAARAAFERAVEILAEAPRVVVHGEWFPSNVLVTPRSRRLAVVDWELAGVGPAAVDLASMTAGWPEERARELVERYRRAAGLDGGGAAALRRQWAAARVVGAVHRLADERGRTPLERDHDWWDELGGAAAHLDEEDRCTTP